MKRILLISLSLLLIATALPAQTPPDAAELTKLLQDFLAGASKNDIAMHDRFWADELVYTSALGRRKSKPDIMRELREFLEKAIQCAARSKDVRISSSVRPAPNRSISLILAL